ncbi:hypothetical protein BDZ89DRAFT_1130612 [Hymenopellis radicata]|nr:hypothetical protein BDZ89DRAFT_1130612 [Hymenopellis radicata]
MGSAIDSAPLNLQDVNEATALQFLSRGDIDDLHVRPLSSLEGSSFSEPWSTGNEPIADVSSNVIPDIITSRIMVGSVGEDGQFLSAGKQMLSAPSNDISSVSTAFHPAAHLIPSDIVLKTSDAVLFYVHRSVLDDVSNNAFGTLLTMAVSFRAPYNPSFATLVRAVDRLPLYGLSPPALITSNNHLFGLLYSHAPHHPIETYMLAAQHHIDELAVLVSGHLLSFKLNGLTDEMADAWARDTSSDSSSCIWAGCNV